VINEMPLAHNNSGEAIDFRAEQFADPQLSDVREAGSRVVIARRCADAGPAPAPVPAPGRGRAGGMHTKPADAPPERTSDAAPTAPAPGPAAARGRAAGMHTRHGVALPEWTTDAAQAAGLRARTRRTPPTCGRAAATRGA